MLLIKESQTEVLFAFENYNQMSYLLARHTQNFLTPLRPSPHHRRNT